VVGRRAETIITGGENVHPAEVELALEKCPGVRRACVFGVAEEKWGEVVAAVVERDPATWRGEAAIGASLAAELAPFKRPRRLAIVAELPRVGGVEAPASHSKIDRARVRAEFARRS
jgi:acyl-CoA synthetase (AMP-forming)/AMP-acid ligase II